MSLGLFLSKEKKRKISTNLLQLKKTPLEFFVFFRYILTILYFWWWSCRHARLRWYRSRHRRGTHYDVLGWRGAHSRRRRATTAHLMREKVRKAQGRWRWEERMATVEWEFDKTEKRGKSLKAQNQTNQTMQTQCHALQTRRQARTNNLFFPLQPPHSHSPWISSLLIKHGKKSFVVCIYSLSKGNSSCGHCENQVSESEGTFIQRHPRSADAEWAPQRYTFIMKSENTINSVVVSWGQQCDGRCRLYRSFALHKFANIQHSSAY